MAWNIFFVDFFSFITKNLGCRRFNMNKVYGELFWRCAFGNIKKYIYSFFTERDASTFPFSFALIFFCPLSLFYFFLLFFTSFASLFSILPLFSIRCLLFHSLSFTFFFFLSLLLFFSFLFFYLISVKHNQSPSFLILFLFLFFLFPMPFFIDSSFFLFPSFLPSSSHLVINGLPFLQASKYTVA